MSWEVTGGEARALEPDDVTWLAAERLNVGDAAG